MPRGIPIAPPPSPVPLGHPAQPPNNQCRGLDPRDQSLTGAAPIWCVTPPAQTTTCAACSPHVTGASPPRLQPPRHHT
ncbi:hypothetical protein PIB30_064619, partial [Stylosanthes scabra]|nr:hypothetical protein [Stylosanthes scabra]